MGIVSSVGCSMGTDPELFFEKDGKIIGSEKVLPAEGVNNGMIVRDGIQLELHPYARSCRQELSESIADLFRYLQNHLAQPRYKGVRVSFTPTIEVTRKEHLSLTPESRRLGCQPSLNASNPFATIDVNPDTYRKRSAGGHIHLGSLPFDIRQEDLAGRIVRVMNVLLGNTCVLIDRDPQAHIRRRNYGRAGEYRLPSHGLEYRTLSNFWLHSYPLMSFVFAMARLSIGIVYYPYYTKKYGAVSGFWDAEQDLMDRVSKADIDKAINKNDFDLAWKNWEAVKGFIQKHQLPANGLNAGNVANFEKFVLKVKEHGLTYFWPQDPMTHWCTHNYRVRAGWESFLLNIDHNIASAEARLASTRIEAEATISNVA